MSAHMSMTTSTTENFHIWEFMAVYDMYPQNVDPSAPYSKGICSPASEKVDLLCYKNMDKEMHLKQLTLHIPILSVHIKFDHIY